LSTQNEIIKSSKFTIALDAHVEKDKCIVRHQFSIPEGKDFRDSEMTTLIESINRVISKCISLLSEISVNEIYINDKFEGNDILYTFTADAKTIKIANKEYLLFYIPKTVEEIEGNINLSKINLTRLPKYFPNVKG
jgi:hypothetical protein